jgi:hypothetical protein
VVIVIETRINPRASSLEEGDWYIYIYVCVVGGIYERDFVFFSAIFLLKFRKMGPRTKLPKSPRSLPPQPLVDLSALENFQPRPINTFSVARNIKYRI